MVIKGILITEIISCGKELIKKKVSLGDDHKTTIDGPTGEVIKQALHTFLSFFNISVLIKVEPPSSCGPAGVILAHNQRIII